MGLTLNITAGNDKRVVLQLLNGLHDEGREPFPVELSEDVAVKMVSEVGTRHAVSFTVGDEGRVLLDLKGSDYKIGLWGIEVVGRLNGAKWRAYGDSMIHYTATTERGAELVTVQADGDELTLVVGYATDIVPKRTSELVNDGADGEHPFVSEEQLKRYAPLESPKFTGYPEYNDTGQSAANFNTLRLTSKNWVYRFIEWFKTQANGIASLVNGKVPTSQIPDLPYIPSNKKGAANGVAELDANRKVFNDQLYFAPRGTTTAAAMDGELEAGLYLVNGFKVADDVLGGDNANGFLLQGTGASRGQLLVVGRAADAAAGEQVEIYTRRYLPTPKRWTAWSKGGGGEPVIYDVIYNEDRDYYYTETECYDEYEQYKMLNIPVFFRIVSGSCPADANKLISLCSNNVYFFLSDEHYGILLYDWVFLKTDYFGVDDKRILLTRMDIKQILPIRFSKSSTTVSLNWRGITLTSFTDSNTTYKVMTAAQANAGTATTGLLISPKVLADYIKDRIGSSISQYYLIELNKIGENQYEVDDPQMVDYAIIDLNARRVLKCQVEVKVQVNVQGYDIFPLARFYNNMLWFSYASAEESVIYEVQIVRDSVTGVCSVDYFLRLIPSE